MAYATVDELKAYVSQLASTTSTVTDAVLEDVLERATDTVDDELGFSFADWVEYAEATARDVNAGAGGRILFLPAHQADSVESVEMVSGRGTASEGLTAVTDYVVETRWRLYRDGGWRPATWYRVAAVWGVGPAPASIVQVTLEVAVTIWQGRTAGAFSPVVGVEGGGAVAYKRALTWDQRARIQRVASTYRWAL